MCFAAPRCLAYVLRSIRMFYRPSRLSFLGLELNRQCPRRTINDVFMPWRGQNHDSLVGDGVWWVILDGDIRAWAGEAVTTKSHSDSRKGNNSILETL